MTAAIYAARANLSVLLLEKEICGGLANWTHVVENYPSYQSINGMELMEKVKEHVESLPVQVEEITEVTSYALNGDHKTITTIDGQEFKGKTVILAVGRVPRNLSAEADGFEERIHYCSVCDGTMYKGKEVLVVGGGNSGFDESLYLESLGVEKITIVEAMDACIADSITQEKSFATGKISAKTSVIIKKISPKENKGEVVLEDVNTGEQSVLLVDGVFVFIGQSPNTESLHDRVALDDYGYVVTDDNMHTNVSGVFAAGDGIAKKYRQLTTAMSDGTIAAMEAAAYVRNLS